MQARRMIKINAKANATARQYTKRRGSTLPPAEILEKIEDKQPYV
jgi:hypothetical protein